jgi:hypothetical protein
MGMRHGLIAATAPHETLLAVLNHYAGELAVAGPLGSPYDAFDEGTPGWELAIGEHNGRSFVLDAALVLSNSPDMLHAMSAEVGLVVGAGADTMFGSFWFTAVRDGEVLRFVYVDAERMTHGMAIGDELASEAEHPLDGDLDGAGLLAAMATLDVDPRPWLDNGSSQLLTPVGRRYPQPGAIERIRTEHANRYRWPDDGPPATIIAIPRD